VGSKASLGKKSSLVPNFYTWRREAMAPRAVPSRVLAWPARAKHIKIRTSIHCPEAVMNFMATSDARAGYRPALFSLPEAAPAMVLRVGCLLKQSGRVDAAAEVYEHFIAGLQHHALCPVVVAPPGIPVDDGGEGARLLRSLPVRSHPERYTFA